jgi:acyl transferase domain-containing protein
LLTASHHPAAGFARAEKARMPKAATTAAINALRDRGADDSWDLPKGVHYRRQAMDLRGKVVALFSGQGSQYVDMGKELVSAFPPMMDAYQAVDRLFVQDGWSPVSFSCCR